MDITVLISYFLTTLALAIAPGPDNLFILSQSAVHGFKGAFCVILGLCTSLVLQTILAAFGIGAIIMASETLFFILKLLGATYLLYLAIMCFVHLKSELKESKAISLSNKKLYIRGIFMNLTNPKVLIFFIAFVPQFITMTQTPLLLIVNFVILGFLIILATLIVFSAIAYLASYLHHFIYKKKVKIALSSVEALIFLALSLYTILLSSNA